MPGQGQQLAFLLVLVPGQLEVQEQKRLVQVQELLLLGLLPVLSL